MSKINKIFSFSKRDDSYSMFNEKEKTLIENGIKIAKEYMRNKAKETSKNDVLGMLGNAEFDTYTDVSNKFTEALTRYCAVKAGLCEKENFNIEMVKNPMINKSVSFRENFNIIVAQILTPIVPAMVSADFLSIADISNIAYGDTARFVVNSNDTFYIYRQAEGIRDGSVQRTYNNELVVNPEPYGAKVAVDWYQVASGQFDIGSMAWKVGYSYAAYINQMIIHAVQDNIIAGATASSNYFTNGFTTQKFTTLAERLSAANNGANVRAYGTLSALSAIIPSGAAGSNIANMQMQLGDEWSKAGHIGRYMGVDLVRMPQILLPNTVNSIGTNSALFGIPNETIYMFADGGYRPVKLVFEGQTVTIDLVPSETSDKEMGIDVQMRIGMTFVAASKYGAITGVAL